MKVIIASTIVPFVKGGGTFIVDWLEQMLVEYGHQVETLKIPFHSWYPEMLDQMLALRLLDLTDSADRLIAIRTPSYLLRHPNKVLWFIHHHRTAYDLWGTKYQEIPSTVEGLRYRDAIYSADNVAFREARRIFTNSRVVSARLKKFNEIDSEVLYPPLMQPERYRTESYGDYILYVSRLVSHKRQDLAVKAMRYTRTPVRLVVAGAPDAGPGDAYVNGLCSFVEQHNLRDRVTILQDWISEDDKIKLFSNCLASIYIPLDEDSYGYSSLESHHARKAVITTTDSGGPPELIHDGENGFIVDPDPKVIARAMDRLYEDRALAQRMGEAGVQRISELGITWDTTIARLLEL
jgi:glycosyltransferase involved in cell wall biosynthesis